MRRPASALPDTTPAFAFRGGGRRRRLKMMARFYSGNRLSFLFKILFKLSGTFEKPIEL